MHADAVELMLTQARAARWHCPPNPAVGAVALSPQGAVLALGHTQQTGGPHAEVMMLRDAQARGVDLRGATVYVSLEPCAHQGRTGPCCDALIEAGIAEVVASLQDPNPRVAGRGFARLRAAGIGVTVGPGAATSRELNIGFFSRMQRGTPWVRLKIAASLDGQTALADGRSQWITSEASRADGHAWRAQACAVLTGIGTVLADDPRLDARAPGAWRQPHLVVIDSQLRTPERAALFGPRRQVFIYTASDDEARAATLRARGAVVVQLPGPHGNVDLSAVLRDLAAREVNEVHVEAGRTLAGAFLRAGLADELLVYLAPTLLGAGRGMAQLGALADLHDGIGLRFEAVDRIGPDLRLRLRAAQRADFHDSAGAALPEATPDSAV